ncbi:SPOR domain-containing protein [Thermodesulfobacteriota bacterium]
MKSKRIRKINLLSRFRNNGNSYLKKIPRSILIPLIVILLALPFAALFLLVGSQENTNTSTPSPAVAPQQTIEKTNTAQLPEEEVSSEEPDDADAPPPPDIATNIPEDTQVQQQEETTVQITEQTPLDESRPSFTLIAGTRVGKKHFPKLQKIADRLGLTLQVHADEKEVSMIRLSLGTHQSQDAKELLNKLQNDSINAFTVHQDGGIAIYAGSFYYSRNARNQKSVLESKGYGVEEIFTKVTLPVYTAYIGNFASQDEAVDFKQNSKQPTIKEMKIQEIPNKRFE